MNDSLNDLEAFVKNRAVREHFLGSVNRSIPPEWLHFSCDTVLKNAVELGLILASTDLMHHGIDIDCINLSDANSRKHIDSVCHACDGEQNDLNSLIKERVHEAQIMLETADVQKMESGLVKVFGKCQTLVVDVPLEIIILVIKRSLSKRH